MNEPRQIMQMRLEAMTDGLYDAHSDIMRIVTELHRAPRRLRRGLRRDVLLIDLECRAAKIGDTLAVYAREAER